ncbi:hypothetical protein TRFO_29325 [Tritrichomonas foetus]|uniref:Uncharacterized protein n=1 Tax=Tritrichomonas foetus TaxID=1144522 RepID=A0A1J4JWC0_9EUKA|nr:hypothetical protein TRFO_29325 [Tritrichomonas foetus]|eukprot:OHT03291.1 hypothetical protein TRFO_29325 [Tritrichomonas foetus]
MERELLKNYHMSNYTFSGKVLPFYSVASEFRKNKTFIFDRPIISFNEVLQIELNRFALNSDLQIANLDVSFSGPENKIKFICPNRSKFPDSGLEAEGKVTLFNQIGLRFIERFGMSTLLIHDFTFTHKSIPKNYLRLILDSENNLSVGCKLAYRNAKLAFLKNFYLAQKAQIYEIERDIKFLLNSNVKLGSFYGIKASFIDRFNKSLGSQESTLRKSFWLKLSDFSKVLISRDKTTLGEKPSTSHTSFEYVFRHKFLKFGLLINSNGFAVRGKLWKSDLIQSGAQLKLDLEKGFQKNVEIKFTY